MCLSRAIRLLCNSAQVSHFKATPGLKWDGHRGLEVATGMVEVFSQGCWSCWFNGFFIFGMSQNLEAPNPMGCHHFPCEMSIETGGTRPVPIDQRPRQKSG